MRDHSMSPRTRVPWSRTWLACSEAQAAACGRSEPSVSPQSCVARKSWASAGRQGEEVRDRPGRRRAQCSRTPLAAGWRWRRLLCTRKVHRQPAERAASGAAWERLAPASRCTPSPCGADSHERGEVRGPHPPREESAVGPAPSPLSACSQALATRESVAQHRQPTERAASGAAWEVSRVGSWCALSTGGVGTSHEGKGAGCLSPRKEPRTQASSVSRHEGARRSPSRKYGRGYFESLGGRP